jgi:hypothetical protein
MLRNSKRDSAVRALRREHTHQGPRRSGAGAAWTQRLAQQQWLLYQHRLRPSPRHPRPDPAHTHANTHLKHMDDAFAMTMQCARQWHGAQQGRSTEIRKRQRRLPLSKPPGPAPATPITLSTTQTSTSLQGWRGVATSPRGSGRMSEEPRGRTIILVPDFRTMVRL